MAIGQTVADMWQFFDFFGFVMHVFGPPTKSIGGVYYCANLVGIDAVALIICKFDI